MAETRRPTGSAPLCDVVMKFHVAVGTQESSLAFTFIFCSALNAKLLGVCACSPGLSRAGSRKTGCNPRRSQVPLLLPPGTSCFITSK